MYFLRGVGGQSFFSPLGGGSLPGDFGGVERGSSGVSGALSSSVEALRQIFLLSGGEFLVELQHTHVPPSWNERHGLSFTRLSSWVFFFLCLFSVPHHGSQGDRARCVLVGGLEKVLMCWFL